MRRPDPPHAGSSIESLSPTGAGAAALGGSLSMRDVSAWVADRERVRVLQDISGRLAAAATPDEVCDITAEAGIRVLGAAASAVALVPPSGGQARVAATRGFPPEILERWRTIDLDGDAPIAAAVRERTPVFMDSLDDLRARFPSLERPGDGRVAWAAVPLEAPPQVIGALALSFENTSALAPPKRN